MACSMLSVTPLAARGAPARPVLTRKAPRARRAVYATAAFVARPAPAPLPPPPEKATLWHVLPYLAQLACAESRMVLRLSLAMVALLIAKGSGARPPAPQLHLNCAACASACGTRRICAHRAVRCSRRPAVHRKCAPPLSAACTKHPWHHLAVPRSYRPGLHLPPSACDPLSNQSMLKSCAPLRPAGLTAPFFFKRAVDRLVDGATAAASAEACVAGLLLFGLMRLLSQCSKELQMPLFTPIGQARTAPQHLHH